MFLNYEDLRIGKEYDEMKILCDFNWAFSKPIRYESNAFIKYYMLNFYLI